MSEKKWGNGKLQIIFSSILLAVVFIVELYAMINLSGQFLVIGLLGILFLVCLYILISGIMAEITKKQERREEQYESIFKSEKASYLMLKKYFEEIEDKLILIEKSAKVPTEEIVGTQKGIGKVIINRSRENADAVINSNEQLLERIENIGELLEGNNTQLISTYKDIENETVQQILMKQQDLIMNLKDMELRLNNAIMQSQKVIAAAAPVMQAPMMQAVTNPTPVQSVPPVVAEPIVNSEPEVAAAEPEIATAEPEIAAAEPEVAAAEPEVVAAEPEVAAAEPIPEDVTEEKPPMPDLSDPNKVMSPDEIAALLANMTEEPAPQSEPEAVAAPEAEAASASEPEVAAAEPVAEETAEEKPPMPDMSDPNKVMSPDDIAALFAAMG